MRVVCVQKYTVWGFVSLVLFLTACSDVLQAKNMQSLQHETKLHWMSTKVEHVDVVKNGYDILKNMVLKQM